MKFASPNLAYLFFIPVILLLFYFWSFKSKRRSLLKFAHKDMLSEIAGAYYPKKTILKNALTVTGVIFCVLAILRPQWGVEWQEVKRKGLDILIAVDTSKSMLAEDIKPNRFERSKLAIRDILKELKGDRVGLIAFSGTAFLQCPLTVDYNGMFLALDDLAIGSIPKGGTSISSAINEAVSGYEDVSQGVKILIVITDGEDHEGDAVSAARLAKKQGITIFCIGIGTREGELIPFRAEDGSMKFQKDSSGNVIKTRLNESVLEKVALTSGGSYIRASATNFGLEYIYNEKLSKLEKREIESKMRKRFNERFQWPLTIGLILLISECFISERKKNKDF